MALKTNNVVIKNNSKYHKLPIKLISKKILIFIIIIIFVFPSFSSHYYANSVKTTSAATAIENINIAQLKVDKAGNTIVAINFNSFEIPGFTESTIQKISKDGIILWRLYFEFYHSLDVILDKSDNIYLFGVLDAKEGSIDDKFRITSGGLVYLIIKITPEGSIGKIQYFDIHPEYFDIQSSLIPNMIIEKDGSIFLNLNNIDYDKYELKQQSQIIKLNDLDHFSSCSSLVLKLDNNLNILSGISYIPIDLDNTGNHVFIDNVGNIAIINSPFGDASDSDLPNFQITQINIFGEIINNKEFTINGNVNTHFEIHNLQFDENGELIILSSKPVSQVKTLNRIFSVDRINFENDNHYTYNFELYNSGDMSYSDCLADDDYLTDEDCDMQNLHLEIVKDNVVIVGETPVSSLDLLNLPGSEINDETFDEDIFVFSLSKTLDFEWGYFLGKLHADRLLNLEITTSESLLESIYIQSSDTENNRVNIHKLNSDGTHAWSSLLDDSIEGDNLIDNPFFVFPNSKESTTVLTWENNPTSLKNGFFTKITNDGTFESTKTYGGSQNDIFTHVIQLPSRELIVGGKTISNDFPTTVEKSLFNGVIDTFILKLSPTGEIQWSLFIGAREEISFTPENPLRQFILIVIISAIAIGLYILRGLYLARTSERIIITEQIEGIIGDLFRNRTPFMYVFLGGMAVDDSQYMKEIRSQLPSEIIEFKFLLHPIRLSISKLLSTQMKLSTIELREMLGIRWSEFYNHLEALRQKKYISVSQEFVEGAIIKFVMIEPYGLKSFETVKKGLINFLNDDHIHRYLEQAISFKDSHDDMYPTQYK